MEPHEDRQARFRVQRYGIADEGDDGMVGSERFGERQTAHSASRSEDQDKHRGP